jgi:hypothetical protein
VVLLADAALLDEITRRRLGLFAAAMEQKYGAPLATLEQWLIDPPKPVVLTETIYDPHPILGFTYGDVLTYYRQIVGLDPPGERAYSYGSRMRGAVPESPVERLKRELQEAVVSETLYMRGMQTAASKPAVDQIAAVGKLLADSPETRAAYLTPWRPEEDLPKK